MTETRKLAAILVSDVAGYSRLAGGGEEGMAGGNPRRRSRRSGRKAIAKHREPAKGLRFGRLVLSILRLLWPSLLKTPGGGGARPGIRSLGAHPCRTAQQLRGKPGTRHQG